MRLATIHEDNTARISHRTAAVKVRSTQKFGRTAAVAAHWHANIGAMSDISERSVAAVQEQGVEANARLTGMAGAVLFVLLAFEGVTILRVHSLLGAHAFVGMMLIPVVLLKLTTTGYRIVRYYQGDRPYVGRGPPPLLLRVVGPFVVVLTVAVLGTGIVAAVDGPRTRWLFLHKATFVLWFGAMTVHVLGHLLDTSRLAFADLNKRDRVGGALPRALILGGALLAGVLLAFATRGVVDAWLATTRF